MSDQETQMNQDFNDNTYSVEDLGPENIAIYYLNSAQQSTHQLVEELKEKITFSDLSAEQAQQSVNILIDLEKSLADKLNVINLKTNKSVEVDNPATNEEIPPQDYAEKIAEDYENNQENEDLDNTPPETEQSQENVDVNEEQTSEPSSEKEISPNELDVEQDIDDSKDEEDRNSESTSAPKEFHIFNHSLEKAMEEKIKTLDKDSQKELDNFMYKSKQLFPYINGEISLFGLYILKTLIDLFQKKEDLTDTYKLAAYIPEKDVSLYLNEFDNNPAEKADTKKDEENNLILFKNVDQINKIIEDIYELSQDDKIILYNEKKFSSLCKEEPFIPINPSNLLTFPFFSLEKIENLIESSNSFEKLLNFNIPKIEKTAIKLIHYKEWTKTKWINYFEDLKKYAVKLLTKEEQETFEFQDSIAIYNRFETNMKNSDSDLKIFVITDCSILPSFFKKEKDKKLMELYNIVYFSWLRYLIKPQMIKQNILEYFMNMYNFSISWNLYAKGSSYNFRPELFTKKTILIDNEENKLYVPDQIEIKKDNFKIETVSPFSLSIAQLNYLFGNHTIDWLEFNFIIEQLNLLIDNHFIIFHDSSFYLNPKLIQYYDVLTSDKFNHFSTIILEAFNSYFSQDEKTFVQKIAKINAHPF